MRNVFPVGAQFFPYPTPHPHQISTGVIHHKPQTKGTVLLVFFGFPLTSVWCAHGKPKVTMFAVEMWFGAGLGMALSVDTRRGSAPCRWAFPGVLFIIKKMLERNFW